MESSSEHDIIDRFMRDAGVPAEVLAESRDPDLEEAILAELEAITRELPQLDTGGTRIMVAGRHIDISEAGWKLLTSSVSLGISTVDPTGLTLALALKEGLDLLKELRPLLKKLDPGKLLVCSAIESIAADKKRKQLAEAGASEQDIEKCFSDRGESTPLNLKDILKSLESDGVLETTYYQHSGPYYKVNF